MSELERGIVEEMSKIRTDPTYLIPHLENFLSGFKGSTYYAPGSNCGLMTYWKPRWVREGEPAWYVAADGLILACFCIEAAVKHHGLHRQSGIKAERQCAHNDSFLVVLVLSKYKYEF